MVHYVILDQLYWIMLWLTHWGWNKMSTISQMTLSNAFSLMKLNISVKISLKFVPKGPMNNIPSLVQIMAWHCPCNKPLSEPMMLSLLIHICITRPQWNEPSVLIADVFNVYLFLLYILLTFSSVFAGCSPVGLLWAAVSVDMADTNSSNVAAGYQHVSSGLTADNGGVQGDLTSPEECMLFSFILDTLITGTLCMAGFAGNVLSFMVLWQEKSHASIMFLLEALIVADLTVIWMIFLQDVVPGLAYVIPLLRGCEEACRNIMFVTRPLLHLAKICVMWFTVCAAINRFIITCVPSQAPLICTVEFARRQVIIIMTIGIIFCVPFTFDMTLKIPLYDTHKDELVETLFNVSLYQYIYVNGIVFFFALFLPLVITIYVCLKLVQLMNSMKRIRRAVANLYKSQNTEMSQVILTLCITLCICYIPSAIKCVLYWTQVVFEEHCGHLNFYLDSFLKLFLALNSSMKMVIFLLFAQGFSETLKHTLCWHDPKKKEPQIFGMYKCTDMSEMTLMSSVETPSWGLHGVFKSCLYCCT